MNKHILLCYESGGSKKKKEDNPSAKLETVIF